jgi:uncharacterized integral membrane protein
MDLQWGIIIVGIIIIVVVAFAQPGRKELEHKSVLEL